MSENDINTHVVLVMGIVQKGKKFLLAKRSSKDPQAPGIWAIPGGKVDLETGPNIIEETLKRELLEEVGIEIEDQIKFVCNDAFIRVSGHHVVGLVFLAKYKSGKATPLEDQEDVGWFTLDEMEKITNEYNRKRIKALRKLLV